MSSVGELVYKVNMPRPKKKYYFRVWSGAHLTLKHAHTHVISQTHARAESYSRPLTSSFPPSTRMSHRVVTTSTSTSTSTTAADVGFVNLGYCRSSAGLLKLAQVVSALIPCNEDSVSCTAEL